MVELDIKIDAEIAKKIKRLSKKNPKLLDTAIKKTAVKAKKLIVNSTPIKTGQARRSIQYKRISNGFFRVFGDGSAPYLQALETGVKAFGVKSAKYLRFPIIKGNTIVAWVTTKNVKGFEAFKMFSKNTLEIEKFLKKSVLKAVKKNLKRA